MTPSTRALPARPGLRQALAGPLLLAVAAQNVGNLVLHAVLGRTLGPAEYGALGTVLSLMVLLTVPLGALQASASAAAARDGGATNPRGLARVIATALLVGLAVSLAAPVVRDAFHLDSLVDAAVLGPFVATSIVLAVLRGRLLGVGRIGLVALTFLASVVTRLVITLALLHVAPVTGALLATLAGELVALAIALVSLRGLGIDRLRATWLPAGDVARSGVVIGGLFLVTTVDLFLARALLPAADSGAYVAAATLGKTLLALPAAALAAAYPRLVRAGRGPSRPAELRRTGIVVCGLAALGALVVAAVPDLVLAVLYGGSYPDAGSLVRVLALVAGASSVISIATYALLAVRSTAALLPLAGAVLEAAVIAHWHGTTLAVARGSALATAVTGVVLAVALARDVRRRATPDPAPARLRLVADPIGPAPRHDPITVS